MTRERTASGVTWTEPELDVDTAGVIPFVCADETPEVTENKRRWAEALRAYARDQAAATRAAQGLMREHQGVLEVGEHPGG